MWVLLAAASVAAWAAPAEKSIATVTPEAYRAHLNALQTLVGACQASSAGCDPAKVGSDDRVEALHFDVRWQWLRRQLQHAKDAKPDEREAAMRDALARLNEMATQSAAATDPAAQALFARARPAATAILDSPEFREVSEFSWWDRLRAKLDLWLTRIFSGVSDWTGVGATLMTILEVVLYGGAAVGLVLLLRRNLARQRLAIAGHMAPAGAAWDRESNDWAAQADESAARGDFRDAVHCLYWAAIVMLEGRRFWRHNPTRTPREYVRLLQPGSTQQGALRRLTQMFERLWYGLREAERTDYEQARSIYETLRDKTPEAAPAATEAA